MVKVWGLFSSLALSISRAWFPGVVNRFFSLSISISLTKSRVTPGLLKSEAIVPKTGSVGRWPQSRGFVRIGIGVQDIFQSLFRPQLVELIQHDDIGHIQHIDLFQLHRGAIFACHHIERDIGKVDNSGIPLADPCGFQDDEIEMAPFHQLQGPFHGRTELMSRGARGHRTQKYPVVIDGIHSDAVAQQSSAGHLFWWGRMPRCPHGLWGSSTDSAGRSHPSASFFRSLRGLSGR